MTANGDDGPAMIEIQRKDSGEIIDSIPSASREELDAAAAGAAEAFDRYRRFPACDRAAILRHMEQAVSDKSEDLARTLALEAGKPIRLARGEVSRALHTIRSGAEEASRMEGTVQSLDEVSHARLRLAFTRRFPTGPVLGITPFNFPLNLVAHKMVPALACGAPIVIKPASATPLSALALGRIAAAAGAPPGVVSVVPCRGKAAERLARDPRFTVLTFTGSAAVGWHLKAIAGRKKVVLELGGNAACVVHDDADLDAAAAKITAAAFGYAGQSCISVQRVLAARAIHDDLLDRLVQRAKAARLGDLLDEKTDLGPMIDEAAAIRAASWIDAAVKDGAGLATGCERSGSSLPPTILTEVPCDADAWAREAFAPLICVRSYESWEEAVRLVNDSDFGLQAGIFTRDIGRILSAWDDIVVGGLMVNEVPTWRVDHMPYGGVKGSGLGREGVRYAIEDMTEQRLMVINRN